MHTSYQSQQLDCTAEQIKYTMLQMLQQWLAMSHASELTWVSVLPHALVMDEGEEDETNKAYNVAGVEHLQAQSFPRNV